MAALFPQVVIAENPAKKKGGGGIKLKAREEGKSEATEVALHPSCIASKQIKSLLSPYLVYHERVKTTRVYIRDATPVPAHALLLFAGRSLTAEQGQSGGGGRGKRNQQQSADIVLRLDGCLGFKCPR